MNEMFVETPRIRNSLKARSILAMASSLVGAHAVILTRSES